MTFRTDRRAFIKTVAVTAGAAAAQHLLSPIFKAEARPGNSGMIYRTLGRTGERVSLVGLGGWHIGRSLFPSRTQFGSSARPSTAASTLWTSVGL